MTKHSIKTVGQFNNIYGERLFIGRRKYRFYFRGDDFSKHWKIIDIGCWVFSNTELIEINNIIKNNLLCQK